MYAIKIEPPDERSPVIERSMSSNKDVELIPTAIEICKAEFAMVNPVALYMGHGVYRVFDIDNPYSYAEVCIYEDAN